MPTSSAADGDELLGEARHVGPGPEVFLALCAGDLVGVGEHGLEAAELLDERGRRFFADAGHAGDVVGGVAGQAQHVGHELGGDAEALDDLVGAEHGVVLVHVQGADVLVHELEHVLVAADDVDFHAGGLGAARQGADDVVGLEAGHLDDGDAEELEQLLDERHLQNEVLGHRLARDFVLGEPLAAEGGPAGIEDGDEAFGGEVFDHLAQRAHEAEDRVGRHALGVREPLDGIEGPVGVRDAVEQEQPFRHGGRELLVRGISLY
jgi:hypothetical protein